VLSPGFRAPAVPPRVAPPAVIVIPGYGAPASDYVGLQETLQAALGAGAVVRVVPVTVGTWARTLGGRPVTPVLELVEKAVGEVVAEVGEERGVCLVGHSAGGWIGRIYLSRTAEYCGRVWGGALWVRKLVCLGTPQRSNEAVTRTNMMFVNEQCAGCAEEDVEYVCVAGTGLIFEGEGGGKWRFWEKGWLARLSYGITDGDGGALVGDGIVPTSAAYLEGAQNVELEGIWHSPASPGPWYGDERAVAYWKRFI
jgi:pimeloyl-ACP methyl ester carboxylesterase